LTLAASPSRLQPLSEDPDRPPVNITFQFRTRSMGLHRMLTHFETGMLPMKDYGFSDEV
jgi:hypothetical protein